MNQEELEKLKQHKQSLMSSVKKDTKFDIKIDEKEQD